MNRFYISKEIIIVSMFIMFGINSYSQINKKVNTKVPTRNIKLQKKIPLLIADGNDIYKETGFESKNIAAKKLQDNRRTATVPKNSSSSGRKLNEVLTPRRTISRNAFFRFRGSYNPLSSQGGIFFNPSRDEGMRIVFPAVKDKNYLVELDLSYSNTSLEGRRNRACVNPKITLRFGGVQQIFNLVYGDNSLHFIVNSKTNRRIQIPIGYNRGVSCNNGSYKPTFRFKKVIIKEL